MGMNCSEDPVKMGVFVLPKVSFIMGTFSDPQHMILAFHSGVPPPPPGVGSPSDVPPLRSQSSSTYAHNPISER